MYEHVALDVPYAAYLSIWLDILILILTISALCRVRHRFAFFPLQPTENTILRVTEGP